MVNNEIPNESDYYNTLLSYLKTKEPYIYNILKNGHCELIPYDTYSQKNLPLRYRYRWNAYSLHINFYIPVTMINKITFQLENELCDICDTLIEKKINYDVVKINIIPKIDNEKVEDQIDHVINDMDVPLEIIPSGIQQNAAYMGKYYVYVYYIENILREFIKRISVIYFNDDDYFKHLTVNADIKKKIKERRNDQHAWLSSRSDDDIFYVDFIELNLIIKNNWCIFEKYLPNQSWIQSKIDDIYECRNKIAHNTFLSDIDKGMIKSNFSMIIHQLKSTFQD